MAAAIARKCGAADPPTGSPWNPEKTQYLRESDRLAGGPMKSDEWLSGRRSGQRTMSGI